MITYGVTAGDYRLEDRNPYNEEGFQTFSIKCPNGEKVKIQLSIFGLHNAMNALGAFALCNELKWNQAQVVKVFLCFKE